MELVICVLIGEQSSSRMESYVRALAKRSAILLTALVGCTQPTAPLDYAGYLEGDYQYAASSLAGRITQLSVQRGARMSAGSALFALDAELELAATEEALQRVKRAEAALSDLQSGRRAPEVAALQAQLAQARALEKLALQEAKRAELLAQRKLIAPELLETRRSEAVRAAARVREMRAQLDTAALIGRPAVLLGAQADVAAARLLRRMACKLFWRANYVARCSTSMPVQRRLRCASIAATTLRESPNTTLCQGYLG